MRFAFHFVTDFFIKPCVIPIRNFKEHRIARIINNGHSAVTGINPPVVFQLEIINCGIIQGKAVDSKFVTFLSFELEPECYGEEDSLPQYIPQVPFESLLDEFPVLVTDFYEQENRKSETLCYQKFGSSRLEDIQRLRTMIGIL